MSARIELAVVVAGLAAAAAVLFVVDPSSSSWLPSCPFFTLTGLHCPGCGSTRAAHQILHGRLGAAFELNALLTVSLPVFAYSFASYVSRRLRGRPLPAPRVGAWTVHAVLALIVTFTIVRNLPFAPFSSWAP